MKLLLAAIFLTTSLYAQVDHEAKAKAAALKIVGFKDSRIELSSCGTNKGTFAFHHPTPNTIFTCSGIISGTNRSVIIFKTSKSFSYFEVSNCGKKVGHSDDSFGEYTQKCEVRALDSKKLIPVGAKRVINYFTTWEYSSGYTSFKFINDGISYDGIIVSFTKLMEDINL